MYNEELFSKISMILLFVGAINLGVQGLIGTDLIHAILGTFLSRILYIVIGAAAGFLIYLKYFKKPTV